MRILIAVVTACLPAMLLGGCSNAPPDGQVVARVNGDEITRRELLAEHRAWPGNSDLEQPDVRAALVEQLVQRKLLAQAAQGAMVDRDANFQVEARRSREVVLVERYRQRLSASIPMATEIEVATYMSLHPQYFAGRQGLLVDRLHVDGAQSGPLSTAPGETFEALVSRLASEGMRITRDQQLIDTASDGDGLARRLMEADNGVVAYVNATGDWQALRLIGRWPIAVSQAAQTQQARAAIASERLDAETRRLVAALRSQAEVKIQPGFEAR